MEIWKQERLEAQRARRDEGFIQGNEQRGSNHVNLVNPVYLTSHGGEQ